MAKTLQDRLVSAQALVAKLTAQINAEAILSNVEVGNVVVFKFGRKDSVRNIEGVVKGTRTAENGVKFAAVFVASEDGFDDQTFKVRIADIIENKSVTADEADVDGGEAVDPLDAD